MKVSFVGKGGSGKSTVSSSFVKYLLDQQKVLLAVDADVNMHLGKMLGIKAEQSKVISEGDNPNRIREYLKGTNERIQHVDNFLKSTPPSRGSGFMRLDKDNFIIKNFTQPLGPSGYFMQVGSYTEDKIGDACYHTNLSVIENLLSHALIGQSEWIVCDMVAGTDAFAGPMHFQFDAVIIVAEPTAEGVSVFEQYEKLSRKAGVDERVFVVGNKIENDSDRRYLADKVGDRLLGCISINGDFKRVRREGGIALLERKADIELFDEIVGKTSELGSNSETMLAKLHQLHAQHSREGWVIGTYGEGLENQIDPEFRYGAVKK